MAKEVKFGIAAPVPGESTANLIEYVRKCERGGIDAVWFPDHMVFMARTITPEVWSVIAASAVKTKTIAMGTIGDAHRVHPAVFAHRLATVDHLSGGGRTFVCVGYGEKMNLDPYGIPWDRPLTRVRECVSIMRLLWKGQPVTYRGEVYHLEQAELRITPASPKGIPIFIAATAPRALALAGELGDGWVTNSMPERLFKKKLRTVREGEKKRAKGMGRLEKAIYIFLSLAGTEDEALAALEPIKHALIWPELLEEAGYGIEIDEEYRGLQYTKIMPNDPEMVRRFREMGQKYYTRDILKDFVLAGTRDQVIERIEKYIKAGVDHFILRDFSPDRKRSQRTLMREIIPYFRG
jgi:alkanesulfonate monooxygenase SsuD/methylene tetrahydromethanopterin reductase-like flavin-dependent oxidoreductase (luciferase family)